MRPNRANEEVKDLNERGVALRLVENNRQCYALVAGLPSPAPPWNKDRFDILIAIPAAYDAAELDSFYVELPCAFNGKDHPQIQGTIIDVDGRKWRLVSWHYKEGKPWVRGKDSLETHITHCRGFFLNRGLGNAH
jgi:Prokaryotic E2 family E